MIERVARLTRFRRRPLLSLVVVVFDMPVQAMNTLRSLSPSYQRAVTPGDYEVVVVENRSANMLDPAEVSALGGTFRYLRRDEDGQSPASAKPASRWGVSPSSRVALP